MIKCPNCGYERKKTDEIISIEECPKCGIFYKKWKPAPAEKQAASLEEKTVTEPIPKRTLNPPSFNSGQNKITKIMVSVGLLAVVIIFGHFLLDTLLSSKSSPDKSKFNIFQNLPFSGSDKSQPPPGEDINFGKANQSLSDGNASRKEMSAADLFRKNSRSVIVVKTQRSIGSGFFINSRGHIVTNKHVLIEVNGAEIKTVSGNIYKIKEIVAEDAVGDLVIASTETPSSESVPVNLTSNLPEVGEKIIVIGNPLGLEQTLSDGIVSSVRKNQSGVNYVQITAPISPGNSGGPLLNMYGEVIGVATFQSTIGQNLNFCVAAERIAAMQNGNSQNSVASTAVKQKELYCYADAHGELHFVEWRTGIQILRADGSLDSEKFQNYALEVVGGNPLAIDPEREAQSALDRNKEKIFKMAFPDKSLSNPNLTSYEQQWWNRRQIQFYNEAFNNAVWRKNNAISKLKYMVSQFNYYSSKYNQLQ